MSWGSRICPLATSACTCVMAAALRCGRRELGRRYTSTCKRLPPPVHDLASTQHHTDPAERAKRNAARLLL